MRKLYDDPYRMITLRFSRTKGYKQTCLSARIKCNMCKYYIFGWIQTESQFSLKLNVRNYKSKNITKLHTKHFISKNEGWTKIQKAVQLNSPILAVYHEVRQKIRTNLTAPLLFALDSAAYTFHNFARLRLYFIKPPEERTKI